MWCLLFLCLTESYVAFRVSTSLFLWVNNMSPVRTVFFGERWWWAGLMPGSQGLFSLAKGSCSMCPSALAGIVMQDPVDGPAPPKASSAIFEDEEKSKVCNDEEEERDVATGHNISTSRLSHRGTDVLQSSLPFSFPLPTLSSPALTDAFSFVEQHQPRRFQSSKQANKGNGPGGVSSQLVNMCAQYAGTPASSSPFFHDV